MDRSCGCGGEDAQNGTEDVDGLGVRAAPRELARTRRAFDAAGLRSIDARSDQAVRQHRPGVVLIVAGVRGRELDVLGELDSLRETDPSIRTVVLVPRANGGYLADALRHGAALVFSRWRPSELIVGVIELLQHARKLRDEIGSEQRTQLADALPLRPGVECFANSCDLTRRERQILPWMMIAEAHKEIAKQVCIEPRMVRWHADNIRRKAGGLSWPAIRAKCIQEGLSR
jgi:DNA-binding NarL/FixJ family response regulator